MLGASKAGGDFSGSIARPNTDPIFITLHVDLSNGGDKITGTAMFDAATVPFAADRAVFDGKTLKAPQAGKFTTVLQLTPADATLPQGDGYGTLVVNAAGGVRFIGFLGDGTPASIGTFLSKAGMWPLYVPLYLTRGSIAGLVTFAAMSNTSTLSAQCDWFKPAVPTDAFYPAGFATKFDLIGSPYVKPPAKTRVLNFVDAPANAKITIGAGNGNPTLPPIVATLGKDNTIKALASGKFTMKLQLSTGFFSGTFLESGNGATKKFNGALLQTQNFGSGFINGNAETGFIDLERNL